MPSEISFRFLVLGAAVLITACEGEGYTTLSPPLISVNAEDIDFGTVDVGSRRMRSLMITNIGDEPLIVDSIRLLQPGTPFMATRNILVVAAQSGEMVDLLFAPLEQGDFGASVEVVSNASNFARVFVSLRGIGQPKSDAGVSDAATGGDALISDAVATDDGGVADVERTEDAAAIGDALSDAEPSDAVDSMDAEDTDSSSLDASAVADAGVNDGGVECGTWRSFVGIGAPSDRQQHAAVWTGTEMLIWGGYDATGTYKLALAPPDFRRRGRAACGA